MRNFKLAADSGLSCVLKTIVEPGKVRALPGRLDQLRGELPPGAPILPWVFINGKPAGRADRTKYPYAYTRDERDVLEGASPCRRRSQAAYCSGAGWFQFMRCDAGRGFMFMDQAGRLFRCFTQRRTPIGDLESGTITIQPGPIPCGSGFCSTAYWGLWYGADPWNHVPGLTREASTFCRFGPLGKAG
jgi:hypothetical protein